MDKLLQLFYLKLPITEGSACLRMKVQAGRLFLIPVEVFMPDFLHVTPGWIIGYLSSLQGYEGSLIKLTSKQVRWLPLLGRIAVILNMWMRCAFQS